MAACFTQCACSSNKDQPRQARLNAEPFATAPLVVERGEEVWSIEELLSANELRVEGGIMQHCVATYTRYCQKRESSIWSMRVRRGDKKTRVLTIEVRPRKKLINEALGKANMPATPHAHELLKIWAKQEELQMQPWL